MLSTGFNFDMDMIVGFSDQEIIIQNSKAGIRRLGISDPLFRYLGISMD